MARMLSPRPDGIPCHVPGPLTHEMSDPIPPPPLNTKHTFPFGKQFEFLRDQLSSPHGRELAMRHESLYRQRELRRTNQPAMGLISPYSRADLLYDGVQPCSARRLTISGLRRCSRSRHPATSPPC